MGKNTTHEWKSASENRLTFPWTNTYLEVKYDNVEASPEDGINQAFEIWTCFVVLAGDKNEDGQKTEFPVCSYIKSKNT